MHETCCVDALKPLFTRGLNSQTRPKKVTSVVLVRVSRHLSILFVSDTLTPLTRMCSSPCLASQSLSIGLITCHSGLRCGQSGCHRPKPTNQRPESGSRDLYRPIGGENAGCWPIRGVIVKKQLFSFLQSSYVSNSKPICVTPIPRIMFCYATNTWNVIIQIEFETWAPFALSLSLAPAHF